jgi:hypothetical protein
MHTAKAQINSVIMSMQHQQSNLSNCFLRVSPTGMLRMTNCFQKSADIMRIMGGLVKMGDVRETMFSISQEMTKVCLD